MSSRLHAREKETKSALLRPQLELGGRKEGGKGGAHCRLRGDSRCPQDLLGERHPHGHGQSQPWILSLPNV
ncbi:hypothetical protein SLA2020_026830 [Shorea laevis]